MDFIIEQQRGSHYIFRTLEMVHRLQFGFAKYQFIGLKIAILKIFNDVSIADHQCVISDSVNTNNMTQTIIPNDILLPSEQRDREYESKREAFNRWNNLNKFNRLIIVNPNNLIQLQTEHRIESSSIDSDWKQHKAIVEQSTSENKIKH